LLEQVRPATRFVGPLAGSTVADTTGVGFMRLFAMSLILVGATLAPAAELKITPANSKIAFVGTKPTGSHTGGFKQFTGTVSMPGDDVATATINVEIAVDSIFTDNNMLTNHLKTPDFFDAKTHPKATFTSTSVAASKKPGTTHDITGNLTMHGVTKPVTIPVKVTKDANGVSIDGTFTVQKDAFNMNYGKGMINNDVKVTLNVKASK
jgi:polyisoprenoid-binding protein YceI